MKNLVPKTVSRIFLSLVLMGSAGWGGWFLGNFLIQTQGLSAKNKDKNPEKAIKVRTDSQKLTFPSLDDSEPAPDITLPELERQRKLALRQRRLELGIDYEFFQELVNQIFWERYPARKEMILSSESEDLVWRERWDEIALSSLNRLTSLSYSHRRQLGKYTLAHRQRTYQQVNQLRLSSRALGDLVDAQFLVNFPESASREYDLDQPMGQIWQGIAAEQLSKLESGENLTEIVFSEERELRRVSNTLEPGEGKAYTVYLESGQLESVILDAPYGVLFSVYSPTGAVDILEDSRQRFWSGEVRETGFYEVVVVSQAEKPVNYELRVEISNE